MCSGYEEGKDRWFATLFSLGHSLEYVSDFNEQLEALDFSCDLNQIPYDYTVEVRNRLMGLDLIDRVPDELYGQRFITLYRRQGARPPPRKRNVKQQNGCLRRPYK